MATQRRPVGTFRIATVEWKRKVRAEIERQGVSRAELARLIKSSSAAVTLLLGREDEDPVESSSKLVPKINNALRIAERSDEISDPHLRSIASKWGRLTEEERQVIHDAVDVITKRH